MSVLRSRTTFNLCRTLRISLATMASTLPPLPEIERLSSRVIRILGGNPSKGTNTYLVGEGSKRLLIDTGHGKPIWVENLKKVLSEEHATIDRVLLTHWHPDHVGGVADLLEMSPGTTIHKNEPWEGQQSIVDGQIFETEGVTLRALHSPGHTQDHMSLILEEEDAIFTGDNVLGHGTAVFEDLGIYLKSLNLMSTQVEGRAYPAHGEVIPVAKAKILEYIKHRQERENQIVEILSRPNAAGSDEMIDLTALDIVKLIYTDLGVDMYPAAEGSVRHVLEKLKQENRVSHNAQAGTWHMNDKAAL